MLSGEFFLWIKKASFSSIFLIWKGVCSLCKLQRVATKGLSCHSSVSGQKPAPKGSSSSSSSPKAQYDHSNETLEKASLAF